MGLFGKLKSLFGGGETGPKLPPPEVGLGADELARRIGVALDVLRAAQPQYVSFTIPKRTGGTRPILAPTPPLKAIQRRIARRLLAKLAVHPAAMGFVRKQSIATHALLHAGRAVVVRMDIRDFFPSITASRMLAYFRKAGWNHEAAALLVKLTMHEGRLPQGAPTSPILSNAVNTRLDARLTALVERRHAYYSRYADDLTFSFDRDDHRSVNSLLWQVKSVVEDEGYKLHTKKKLRIMRRHDRQTVTGLVVNCMVNLPRRRRRWLRAVEHHLAVGKPATITPQQLQGWHALEHMILQQTGAPPDARHT